MKGAIDQRTRGILRGLMRREEAVTRQQLFEAEEQLNRLLRMRITEWSDLFGGQYVFRYTYNGYSKFELEVRDSERYAALAAFYGTTEHEVRIAALRYVYGISMATVGAALIKNEKPDLHLLFYLLLWVSFDDAAKALGV